MTPYIFTQRNFSLLRSSAFVTSVYAVQSVCVTYQLHVTLQFADACTLALSGTNITNLVDGNDRTDARLD